MSGRDQSEYYHGVRMVRFDLVKELVVALAGTLALVMFLAAALSSPDLPPETIASWAGGDPVDFVTTATGELAGTTASSQYGAPYNDGSASVQGIGPFSPQSWVGVRERVDSAQDFVIKPLKQSDVGNPELVAGLDRYQAANPSTQKAWLDAYAKALGKATVDAGKVAVEPGDYGPLPIMMNSLLAVARSGGLDGELVSDGHFYQTDYTKPLLFMGDGGHLSGVAQTQHLQGTQWGMMNETGSYPGQTWLWLYTLWYQVPLFSGATNNGVSNTDLLVMVTMMVLSLGLVLTPFIPVINRIPVWLRLHRLIWRPARLRR